MRSYKINFQPKHLNHTFIEIIKKNNFVKEGELYQILDWTNNDNFIRRALLVQISTITLDEIDSSLAYLDKNCSLKIYKEIINLQGFDEAQLFQVLTFSATTFTETSKVC